MQRTRGPPLVLAANKSSTSARPVLFGGSDVLTNSKQAPQPEGLGLGLILFVFFLKMLLGWIMVHCFFPVGQKVTVGKLRVSVYCCKVPRHAAFPVAFPSGASDWLDDRHFTFCWLIMASHLMFFACACDDACLVRSYAFFTRVFPLLGLPASFLGSSWKSKPQKAPEEPKLCRSMAMKHLRQSSLMRPRLP